MDRLVLDTNVVVSAALSASGPPARIVDLARVGAVEIAVSPEILAEYEEVFGRPEFRKISAQLAEDLRRIRSFAAEVMPGQRLRVCSDADDDKFVECALWSQAGFLVTGNLRHFPREFPGLRIISPAAYLRERGA